MAYAALRLLESLEAGKAEERISALRSLRDEVMSSGEVHMRRNAARVLLEIMKEMVRKPEGRPGQLKLAHDFRAAVIGRPDRSVRFCAATTCWRCPKTGIRSPSIDHTHDSSTKGRKSPSHLIMDAWIKGIRRLTVVYYNYVPPKAAEELLEAAEIMGLEVRIGIGFSVRFYGAYIQLIYVRRACPIRRTSSPFWGTGADKGFHGGGKGSLGPSEPIYPESAGGIQPEPPAEDKPKIRAEPGRFRPLGFPGLCGGGAALHIYCIWPSSFITTCFRRCARGGLRLKGSLALPPAMSVRG